MVPLRGMPRPGNSCYIVSVTQVMLRVPAVFEWLRWHAARACPDRENGTCAACAMWQTYQQLLTGFGRHGRADPVSVRCRAFVDLNQRAPGQPGEFDNAGQHDVFSYWGKWLFGVRDAEVLAGRFAMWEEAVSYTHLTLPTTPYV